MIARQWWRKPLIPALRRKRQADVCEFEASLVYRASSRTGSEATEKPCLNSPSKKAQLSWFLSGSGVVEVTNINKGNSAHKYIQNCMRSNWKNMQKRHWKSQRPVHDKSPEDAKNTPQHKMVLYNKPIANIILNCEDQKPFYLKPRNKTIGSAL